MGTPSSEKDSAKMTMRGQDPGRRRGGKEDPGHHSERLRHDPRRLLETRVHTLEPQRDEGGGDRSEGQSQDDDEASAAEEGSRCRLRPQQARHAEHVEPAQGEQKRGQESREGVQQRRGPPPANVRPPHQYAQGQAQGERQKRHERGEHERPQQEGESARAKEEHRVAEQGGALAHEEACERRDTRRAQNGRGKGEEQRLLVPPEGRPQRPAHCRSHGWILSISSATRA